MKKNKTGKKTIVMGILNITPDSFSDGGTYFNNIENAVTYTRDMMDEGADIIDIGGESTRPGAEFVDSKEELKRILPVIDALKKDIGDVIISVDTYKADVAEQVLRLKGVSIINSLGGFIFDKELARVVSQFDCRVVIYHIKGKPKTMQKGDILYDDIIDDISNFFSEQLDFGVSMGMKYEQFILDPGIGFGKTVEQNVAIIKRLGEFKKFQLPIAVGISRKSHLGTLMARNLGLTDIPGTNERLEAGLAETAVAVLNGAEYVRTHDVGATRRFLSVLGEFAGE